MAHSRASPCGSTIRKNTISAPKIMNSMCEMAAVDSGMPSAVGSWFSTSGRITMNAAPGEGQRNDPPPADDHQEEQRKRAVHVEGERLPRAQVDEGPERARHADEERA